MIIYNRLWQTMAKKGITTYVLRFKKGVSNSTVQRLKKNMPVSTYTLNNLCKLLDCSLCEIAEYVPDDE